MSTFNLETLEGKLAYLGLELPNNCSNNHQKNENILDRLFLHGIYADPKNYSSRNNSASASAFKKHQSILAEIPNRKKLDFFYDLLYDNYISKDYYQTQLDSYDLLRAWYKQRFFGEPSEKTDQIEKSSLSMLLEHYLKGDSTHDDKEDRPTNHFRP